MSSAQDRMSPGAAVGSLGPDAAMAEDELLGALLLSGGSGPEASDRAVASVNATGLLAEHFEREKARKLYEAISAVVGRCEPTQVSLVAAELASREQLDPVGGERWLRELLVGAPAVTTASHLAKLVIAAARRRQLHMLATELQQLALNGRVAREADLLDRVRRFLDAPAERESRLAVVGLEAFAQETEPNAGVLVGAGDEVLLAAGANVLLYGEGGAGKTTLMIDAVAHLASGQEWLEFAVPRPLRVLLIENEGPRGPFRRKLQRKTESWPMGPFAHNVFVLEQPWAAFSFADPQHRTELREQVTRHEIDLVVAGPLVTLGMVGGGTPDEVSAFNDHLALFRAGLDRPVAIWLVHHENKAGDVSGAWERWPDTLAHLHTERRERCSLHWRKARWASNTHGLKMSLSWITATEGFDLNEHTPGTSRSPHPDEAARAWILAHVTQHPGLARGAVETAYAQAHNGGRNLARRLISEAVNPDQSGEHTGWLATRAGATATGIYLHPAATQRSPLAATLFSEDGEPR